MYPLTHFLFALVIASVLHLYQIFNIYFVILTAIIGVLVDLDHYLHRIIKFKDYNIKNCWNRSILHKDKKQRTLIHHKKGAMIISVILLGIYFISKSLFLAGAIGYYSHIFLDNLHYKLKEKIKFKEFGFIVRMPIHELIFEVILAILVLLIYI